MISLPVLTTGSAPDRIARPEFPRSEGHNHKHPRKMHQRRARTHNTSSDQTQNDTHGIAIRHFALLLPIFLPLYGCVGVDLSKAPNIDKKDFVFIREPSQRQRDPDVSFSHEYRRANIRRTNTDSVARPSSLFGIAMSGGGIRSAAFQLGILSGLQSRPYANKTLLNRVDYISSVSGGSWANGGYWSTTVPDDEFFACLRAFASTGKTSPQCTYAADTLRTHQSIATLPISCEGSLEQRKQQWEDDIIHSYLRTCNVDFSNPTVVPSCISEATAKPYPIFNSTHSATNEHASATQSPFEITPDYVGTLIDDPGEGSGFFVRLQAPDFAWENRKWQRWFALTAQNRADPPGAKLSLTMAHSSGVVGVGLPFLLQYHFHIHYRGHSIAGLRPTYQLTDGGKSENLGIVPLLERGVETILVSQIGKEGQDFDDLTLAQKQADRLLSCHFKANFSRETAPLVFSDTYTCPGSSSAPKIGQLVHVRPTVQNIKPFLDWLRLEHPSLYQELAVSDQKEERPEDRFPETPTFRTDYDVALIRAYFLLGHFVANGDGYAELRRALGR